MGIMFKWPKSTYGLSYSFRKVAEDKLQAVEGKIYDTVVEDGKTYKKRQTEVVEFKPTPVEVEIPLEWLEKVALDQTFNYIRGYIDEGKTFADADVSLENVIKDFMTSEAKFPKELRLACSTAIAGIMLEKAIANANGIAAVKDLLNSAFNANAAAKYFKVLPNIRNVLVTVAQTHLSEADQQKYGEYLVAMVEKIDVMLEPPKPVTAESLGFAE